MSLAGPKARPVGVVDGSLVDIPEPGYSVEYVGTGLKFSSRRWMSVYRKVEWNRKGKRSGDGGL